MTKLDFCLRKENRIGKSSETSLLSRKENLTFIIFFFILGQTFFAQTLPPCVEKHPVKINLIDAWGFSSDGRLFAQEDGNKLSIYDLNTGSLLKELKGEKFDSLAFPKFSRNGKYIAKPGDGGNVQVWETATGKFLYRLEGNYRGALNISFSPDEKYIAIVGASKTKFIGSPPKVKVRVWEMTTGKEVSAFTPLYSSDGLVFTGLSFSPDGKIIAAVLHNQGGFWEPETGKLIAPLIDPEWTEKINGREEFFIGGAIGQMKFSPDGKFLATVGFYWGYIQIWDVPTGKLLTKIDKFTKEMSFSPDSKLLAFQKEKEVGLWDIAQGKELKRLKGHKKAIFRISFSEDGKLLATSDGKNTIIWNTRAWTNLATIAEARVGEFLRGRILSTLGPGKYMHQWDVKCN